jgi:hypothetical protein
MRSKEGLTLTVPSSLVSTIKLFPGTDATHRNDDKCHHG